MTPNWLKIDKNNLPKGEVVGKNMNVISDLNGLEVTGIIVSFGKHFLINGFTITHYKPLPKDEDREG